MDLPPHPPNLRLNMYYSTLTIAARCKKICFLGALQREAEGGGGGRRGCACAAAAGALLMAALAASLLSAGEAEADKRRRRRSWEGGGQTPTVRPSMHPSIQVTVSTHRALLRGSGGTLLGRRRVSAALPSPPAVTGWRSSSERVPSSQHASGFLLLRLLSGFKGGGGLQVFPTSPGDCCSVPQTLACRRSRRSLSVVHPSRRWGGGDVPPLPIHSRKLPALKPSQGLWLLPLTQTTSSH